jgi:hypothetical protein
MRWFELRCQRTDVPGRMVAWFVAADARAILSGLQPEKRRLVPEQISLGIEGVEAQRHVHGEIHEHGTVGGHRHLSQDALLSRARQRKNP